MSTDFKNSSNSISNNAHFIVILGTPIKEDAIERVKKTSELLQLSDSDIVLIVGTKSEAAFMKEIALKIGISKEKIASDGNSRTTIDNAYYAKIFSIKLGVRKLIVVTSKYHNSRAFAIFVKMFGPDFEIVTSPSENHTTKRMLLRENLIHPLFLLIYLFKTGDHEGLKRASDAFRL